MEIKKKNVSKEPAIVYLLQIHIYLNTWEINLDVI